MNKLVISVILLFTGTFCFSQQSLIIKGKLPRPDTHLYRIQVGAFKTQANADSARGRLKSAGFDASIEQYRDFTRVFLGGISSRDIHRILWHIERLGFKEVWISPDRRRLPLEQVLEPRPAAPRLTEGPLPARENRPPGNPDAAAGTGLAEHPLPDPGRPPLEQVLEPRPAAPRLTEGPLPARENRPPGNPDAAAGTDPAEHPLPDRPAPNPPAAPERQEPYEFLDKEAGATPGTAGLARYRTDRSSRLAYRFVNPGDNPGSTGGIDILGRGPEDIWMWTTYGQEGFSYNVNGRQQTMTDGVLRSSNGIELRVEPSFVYIDGTPCLQLEHKLKNTGMVPVSGQKFGAGADIMIHNNDHVPITHTDYGLSIADVEDDSIADMELRFIAKTGRGITPVSTLRIGPWEQGNYLRDMYESEESAGYSKGADSAMTFSYQNITLAPGETKSFMVRFTLKELSGPP
jgi:hypothetical protein